MEEDQGKCLQSGEVENVSSLEFCLSNISQLYEAVPIRI